MAKRNGSGGGCTGFAFAVFAFETAWEVADPQTLDAGAEGTELAGGSESAKPKAAAKRAG